MVDKYMIQKAAENGPLALKDLFEKLPKEDALKGLGILAILGIGKMMFNTIKEIVTSK